MINRILAIETEPEWRSALNNVFDEQPPFVAGAFENNYDESTTNIKGRTWYVALKKRF